MEKKVIRRAVPNDRPNERPMLPPHIELTTEMIHALFVGKSPTSKRRGRAS